MCGLNGQLVNPGHLDSKQLVSPGFQPWNLSSGSGRGHSHSLTLVGSSLCLTCRWPPRMCSREASSDSTLELFLWLAFVTIIIHNSLHQRILPLCLTVKVPLFRILSTFGWQKGRGEHIPCLRLAILGDIYKINGLFTLFPHLPYLYSIKEPGIQTPIRWDIILSYFETLVCLFFISQVFLASVPCFWFIGLSCGEQSKLGLCSQWIQGV